jgi:predicted transcriptional regulator
MENTQTDLNETLITLASDIVAAHVSNNSVGVDDLPALITNVYGALSGLGKAAPVAEVALPKPAVSVRSSVKTEYLVCLDCGMELKMLKRHLMTHHGMTPDQYRSRWSLSNDYPLVAPAYAEKRRDLAKKIGLGRKPGARRGRKAKVTA